MTQQSGRRRAKLREARDAFEQIADNPALTAAFEDLHALLQEDGFDTEYDLGVAANEARSVGGSVAVRRFAIVADVPEARAHVAARIARAFSRGRVAEIRARKTVYGFRLGLEYFVQLSRVKDSAERDALVERVFHEVLSVDELRDEVDAIVADAWWRTATPERGLARLGRWQRTIARQLPRLIELSRAPGDEGSEAKQLLSNLRAHATAIVTRMERLLAASERSEPN